MSLYAWGKNTYGQLGLKQEPAPIKPKASEEEPANEDRAPRLRSNDAINKEGGGRKPVCVEVDGEFFVAAAAGEHHTLVVTQYGDVKSFGRGREGQLAHDEDSRLDADEPRMVKGLADVTVVTVACGAFHSLAVTSSGRLYEWGLVHTEPDLPSEKEVSDTELLALAGPSQVHDNPTYHLSSVVADSARRWLSAADSDSGSSDEDEEVDEDRALMQRMMMGRLPTRNRQAVPRLVDSLQGMRITSVSAGYAHSVAVSDQGRAFASGQNDRGQLGLGHRIHSGIFREVVGIDDFIVEVACGEQHNLARVLPITTPSSGIERAELYVWGGGRLGQLGLGTASTRLTPTHNPLLSGVGGGVVSVSAGANHSVCAVVSGLVLSWGHAEYNQQGVAVVAGADLMGEQQGHGYFRVPRAVRGLIGTHVVSVHCGSNFTLAVDRDGATHSFGWNEGDTLGRGWQGAFDPSPGPVQSLPGVVSIAAGSRHAAAVTAEGPALGRHLRSLVGDADSADMELLAPSAAVRDESGVPVHMPVIAARCPYLVGHVEAALKAGQDDSSEIPQPPSYRLQVAALCLEHATADSLDLLVRYLYTDEVPPGVSGGDLDTLAGLARETLLSRLEALCVERLPYSLRRRYVQRNGGTALSTSGAADVPLSTFVADLGGLAGRPERADILLVLPAWGWEFHCHKAILCSTPWWYALLKGGFREGDGDEVDLSGLLHEGITGPVALEATIRYVYTNSPGIVVDMDPSTVMEIVILAVFMVLPSLVNACQRELGRYVDAESAPALAGFAHRYHLPKLESLCHEKL